MILTAKNISIIALSVKFVLSSITSTNRLTLALKLILPVKLGTIRATVRLVMMVTPQMENKENAAT